MWNTEADAKLLLARKEACRPSIKCEREPAKTERVPRLKVNREKLDLEIRKHGFWSSTENFRTTWYSADFAKYSSLNRVIADNEEEWRADETKYASVLACFEYV